MISSGASCYISEKQQRGSIQEITKETNQSIISHFPGSSIRPASSYIYNLNFPKSSESQEI